MNLTELQTKAKECTLCSLHTSRVIPVFSKGNSKAKLMICGMCPGTDENSLDNVHKLPFVGKSGKHLDEILSDVSLTLQDVYITNVVKCFLKPGIRLKDEWINNCMPYLICQISIIKPKIIIALGTDAGRALLNKSISTSLASMRNKLYSFNNMCNVIVTYHPSYFLRAGGRNHKHYYRILEDLNYAKKIIST